MKKSKRGAGILLHLTSLPSAFGIGDMGPEARVFVDFLQDNRQTYWQILPINPTEQGQGHSPYSSISSRAGNTLLISPVVLAQYGLIDSSRLNEFHLPGMDKVDFKSAEKVKEEIFNIAWTNFRNGSFTELEQEFEHFVKKEDQWLSDFAMYMVIKQQNAKLPWFKWPEKYRLRDHQALQILCDENKEEVDKIKWLQYIFSKQWHELKRYSNKKGVKFFGDLPFYVSYDSVDVWANKDLFSLDSDGDMIGVAGVPPDAFSDDGQLWGMPVFLWDVLKQQGYKWWIERFRKNIELFDLLRLDHFRAFADYWEVPAEEKTAIKGSWKTGPGIDFFDAVCQALGDLPFIAEDLGEINDAVYELRDRYKFPGMKILQFAFGEEMPASPYIPHNYTDNFIAYTGTHDNNTIKGWYSQEGTNYRQQLQQYLGYPVSEDNIHLAMGRLAFSSVAKIAILPMQDVLGLDENARMNIPASGEDNWGWRLLPDQLPQKETFLREWTEMYNRTPEVKEDRSGNFLG